MSSHKCLSVCVLVGLGVYVELIKSTQQTALTSLFFVQFLTTDESWRGRRKAVDTHAN